MREDLVGYLLGALDTVERRRIEQSLAASPELCQQLEQIRQCLEPLETLKDEQVPPPGLAERVCDSIARHDLDNQPVPRLLEQARHQSCEAVASWSVADALVVALVAVTAFTLFVPALINSRYQARKLACQENLRTLGVDLITFSDRQGDRRFPYVPLSGPRAFAGIFAPTLLDSQMLSSHDSRLICPGSALAEHQGGWYVPSLRQVDAAQGRQVAALRDQAGGSYAYCIGYFDKDSYQVNRNLGRSRFAILADAPSVHLRGRVSANHGGRGQNICYEDGHVAFVTDPHVGGGDDPLRNRLGFAEAGVDRDDAVILRSEMQPLANPPLLDLLPTDGP